MFLIPSSFATGKVLEGRYKNSIIQWYGENIKIHTGFMQRLPLTPDTIESYEVIKEDNNKSTRSVVGRGLLGGLLFGGLGALVGGYTAESNGVVMEVNFKDGSSSILLLPQDFYLKVIYDLKHKNNKGVQLEELSTGGKIIRSLILFIRRTLGLCCGVLAFALLGFAFSGENPNKALSVVFSILLFWFSSLLWGKKK